jgi:hypothetical protein
MRMYQVMKFKKQTDGSIYGAKIFVGNLDRSCKCLIKMYGLRAKVEVIGPGYYRIANGEAELRIVS